MELYLNIISILLLFPMFIYIGTQRNKQSIAYSFMFLHIVAFIWAGGRIIELFAKDYAGTWIAMNIYYLGVDFAGLAVLTFCLIKTNRKIPFYLFVPPIIVHSIFITDPFHHLYFNVVEYRHVEAGFVFNFCMAYSSIYAVVGMAFLARTIFKQTGYSKKQNILLFWAMMIPYITAAYSAINMIFFTINCLLNIYQRQLLRFL